MSEANKAIVRRLVEQVMNAGHLEVIDGLYSPDLAPGARRWIRSFRAAFPDARMTVVELVAEGDRVVGRFTCSGTHERTWRGHPATGRRFRNIAEVYFFRIDNGKIVDAWGVEDTYGRMRQLGLIR